jgi:hypothetical protein
MKFVEPNRFADPDAAARKLVEIANTIEPAQDGRIYIELVNAAFLKAGGTAEQFRAGIQRAVDKGWMVRHESGTYVKFTPAGAELFARGAPGSSIRSSVMRDTDWTPSIAPGGEDLDVCLVVNDFGRRGRAWCETDVEATDIETIIQDLLDGQYWDPVRVVSFNTGEGWARDISADVAEELRRRCEREMPAGLDAFIERHAGTSPRQFTLRLV